MCYEINENYFEAVIMNEFISKFLQLGNSVKTCLKIQKRYAKHYCSTRCNLWLTDDTKVIVQGFTGKQATYHSKLMMEYGTNIVGGTNPKKAGEKHLGQPVFKTVKEAKEKTCCDASLILVPASVAG